jgi:hypothetical protein
MVMHKRPGDFENEKVRAMLLGGDEQLESCDFKIKYLCAQTRLLSAILYPLRRSMLRVMSFSE